jgi:ABC-2 type transport system permease protein
VYLASNPPRVTSLTLLPRAILQTVFIVLLCELAGGPDLRHYALIGTVALTITLSTMVAIADVPSLDKWSGTFWRIRIGRLGPFTVFLLRSWPYPVAGLCTGVVTLFVVAPFEDRDLLGPRLLPALLCFALLAVTTSAAGLAGAAFAVGRRADVLVGNLLAYLTMLGCGGVVPPGRVGWIDVVGAVLPMRHGLAAIRALPAVRPFVGHLCAEAAVGALWFALAWALIRVQAHRARSNGSDDYA